VARLEDLSIVSIADLDDASALQLILDMRLRRRKLDEKQIKKAKDRQAKLDSVLKTMSEAQLLRLATMLLERHK
jgi:hypothetical protein